MAPAVIFDAVETQEGRPSQLSEDFVMDGRHGAPDRSGAAGSSFTPAEAHRGASPTAEHGAIRGNTAAGFTHPSGGAMRLKHYWLLVACSLGLAACVKAAQVALTPEFYAALAGAGTRLLASSGFGFLVAGTGCVFCLSLCAAAWERAQRRVEREDEERARAQAKLLRRMALDTSSLIDDSPVGPLPETWRAPCGELVRLNQTNDRGPKAA